MNQLYRRRKNSEAGYLCTIAILSSNEEKAAFAYEKVEKIKNDIINMETAALDLLSEDYTLRLFDGNSRKFGALISLCSTLAKSIDEFVGLCRDVMEGVDEDDRSVPAYFETKVLLRRMEDSSIVLRDFSVWDEKHDKLAYYIEHDEIEKIDTAFIKVKSFVENDDIPSAVAELETSKFVLEHIEKKYKFNLQNIL